MKLLLTFNYEFLIRYKTKQFKESIESQAIVTLANALEMRLYTFSGSVVSYKKPFLGNLTPNTSWVTCRAEWGQCHRL